MVFKSPTRVPCNNGVPTRTINRTNQFPFSFLRKANAGENSIHTRAATFATYWSAFVHGIAPIPAGLIPLLPFFFVSDLIFAATVATAIALVMLFGLGFVMGCICDESGIYYGGE